MNLEKYPPNPDFQNQAHISSENLSMALAEMSLSQPQNFWKELSKALIWQKPYSTFQTGEGHRASFFNDGQINVSENCLDRHAERSPNHPAIIWRSEIDKTGAQEKRTLSYRELLVLTCQIANSMKSLGISKGDRVLIYLPMVPELVATMQACARIGAVHTVVFAGFSAQSIADRLEDSGAKLVVTADGFIRKGKFVFLKTEVDAALNLKATQVKNVLVLQRNEKQNCPMTADRDIFWKDSVEKEKTFIAAEKLSAEHPLFILYTSGTTGKPKGLFHTHGGYLLWAHWTTRWLFDIKPEDKYWCSADCGWITGHTYIAYGPLSNGAQVFMYEGAPTYPNPAAFYDILENEKISILYTSPTAIRMLMSSEQNLPAKYKFPNIRLLGSVGEPINPEAWRWYFEMVGKERCPIVDTYWQTETGGAVIAPFPGTTTLKPGSATYAMPGIDAKILDPHTGNEVKRGESGALVFTKPWPAMSRGVWGDPNRFENTYWNVSAQLRGYYVTGDLAHQDEEGYFWISGRIDDVLSVAGHRIGSAEVESALVTNPHIYEAAVVGAPDAIKGQSIVAFVEIRKESHADIAAGKLTIETIQKQARTTVGEMIGAHAKPSEVRIVTALPKTRSGKIMRRLLREVAVSGNFKGDTTTLEDFSMEQLRGEED
jgi:acetyl-CoA synthetase